MEYCNIYLTIAIPPSLAYIKVTICFPYMFKPKSPYIQGCIHVIMIYCLMSNIYGLDKSVYITYITFHMGNIKSHM